MANGPMTWEDHLAAFGPRKPWSRKVEIELDEEVIAALAVYVSEEHKGRMREQDAIVLLLKDHLIGLGLLKLGPDDRAVAARSVNYSKRRR